MQLQKRLVNDHQYFVQNVDPHIYPIYKKMHNTLGKDRVLQKFEKKSLSIWHYVVIVKSTVKILSIFMAFLENMNFKEEHVYHTKCNFKIRNSRNIYLVNWFKYKYFELIKHEFFPLNLFLLKTQINSLKTQQKDKLYSLQGYIVLLVKFMFSKKATIIDKIFTIDLTLCI